MNLPGWAQSLALACIPLLPPFRSLLMPRLPSTSAAGENVFWPPAARRNWPRTRAYAPTRAGTPTHILVLTRCRCVALPTCSSMRGWESAHWCASDARRKPRHTTCSSAWSGADAEARPCACMQLPCTVLGRPGPGPCAHLWFHGRYQGPWENNFFVFRSHTINTRRRPGARLGHRDQGPGRRRRRGGPWTVFTSIRRDVVEESVYY